MRPQPAPSARRAPRTAGLALALALAAATAARAAELATSHVVPGGTRPFAVAVAPPPGPTFAHTLSVADVRVDRAALRGVLHRDVDAKLVDGTLRVRHAFERRALGGRFELEAALAYGWIELGARRPFPPSTALVAVRDDRFDLGDLSFTPLSYYWNRGRVHVHLAHAITAPTGGYDARRQLDVGRNHWSFDTTLAGTFFNERSGSEVSGAIGWMTNTENRATRFDSGDELHVDAMLNQWLATNFAVGAHGYFALQTGPDDIAGRSTRGLVGRAVGVGAAAQWAPDVFDRRLTFTARWLHDVASDDRLDGERVTFTIAFAPRARVR
ncbi:MAG: transporter [Myxococcota bacterium]